MSEIEFSFLGDDSPLPGDPATLRAQARMQGYLFMRERIPAQTILALRRQILGLCADIGYVGQADPNEAIAGRRQVPSWDDQEWVHFQGRAQQIPEFAALARHPRIVEIVEMIFDGPALGDQGNVCRLLPPQLPQLVTPPHQDGHFIRNNPNLWTAWVPLGDCPAELGGLAILPHSHIAGLLPHSAAGVAQPSAANWASADYRAGDVLFFHLLTVHRSLPNRTANRIRVSVDMRYRPA